MKIKGNELIKKTMNFGFINLVLATLVICSPFWLAPSAQAQEKKSEQQSERFIDEDGDGFNDLLPDSDGDGIPDLIDPDFKGHPAESLYMNRYMEGRAVEIERNQFQNMHQHGEQGQYGPHDSTGHGGRGGQGMTPGNPGSGGNQGGRNGSGMGGDQGGSSGPGVNPAPPASGQGESPGSEGLGKENSIPNGNPVEQNGPEENNQSGNGRP